MKKIISLLILLLLLIINCVYQKSLDIYQLINLPTSFYKTNILLGNKTLYPKSDKDYKKITIQKPKVQHIQTKEIDKTIVKSKKIIDINITNKKPKIKDINISKPKKIIKIETKQKDINISKELIKEVTKQVININKTSIKPVTLSVKEVISNINHSAIKDRELLLLEIEKAIKKAIKDRLDSIKDIENRNKGN